MNIISIIALILLALAGNILWYWLKSDLQKRGYKTHYFRGHFADLFNAISVINNSDDINTKKIYRGVLFSIVVVIVLMPTIFFSNFSSVESHGCSRFQDYLMHEVHGIVESKFIDETNHNMRTIHFSNGGREVETPIFVVDLFQFLKKNDSISKVSGKTELRVYREEEVKIFNVKRTNWCDD